MAVVDALLEIGRQWDEIEHRIGDRSVALGSEILAIDVGDSTDSTDSSANRFLELLSPSLPDDSPVFDALERHRDRRSGLDDLTPYVLLEDFDRRSRHQMTQVTSIEQFALRVLRDRVVTSPSPVRRAARHHTLQRLTSVERTEGWAGLSIAVQRPIPGLPLPTVRNYGWHDALAFNPIEAFLHLPPTMQTTAMASIAIHSRTSLVPNFQFDDRSMSAAAEKTNQILESWRDPWGTGSWWTRPNGRLGATPLDLLGTEREAEIPAAADALRSESF